MGPASSPTRRAAPLAVALLASCTEFRDVPLDVPVDRTVRDAADAPDARDAPDVPEAPDAVDAVVVPDAPPCGGPCPAGQTCCNDRCVDTAANVDHCGRCGAACSRANGTPSCAMGRCDITCDVGFGNCDGAASNGCEVNLATSVAHCGDCASACGTSRATPTCNTGRCVLACAPGATDCDGNAANGCEVNVNTDAMNCGGCDNPCPRGPHVATVTCSSARCQITCEAGWADCNANLVDGCEVNTGANVLHCGGCGASCASRLGPPPTGQALACVASACRYITQCPLGRGDCDGEMGNACEVDLAVSADHCGACGQSCSANNAVPTCIAGRCGVAACLGSFADCNRSPADGCEVDVRASLENCGACGTRCAGANVAQFRCTTGACQVVACNAPWGNCDGNAANGCEVNTDTNPQHCSGCGRPCALANATAGCAAGACTVVSCNAGFGNCDMNPANGCEANFNASPAHCGGCERRCPAGPNSTPVCVGGACVVACVNGFADCDRNPATGCEVFIGGDPNHCGACGNRCPTFTRCLGGRCTP